MKKLLLSFLVVFLPMMAMGQNQTDELVAEKDWTGGFEGDYPMWGQFGEDQVGSITSDPNGVSINIGSQTGALWYPQVMVLQGASLKMNHFYSVKITAKFPCNGKLQLCLGSFSGLENYTTDVIASGDFQEVEIEFPDYSYNVEDDIFGGFVLFQCGDFLGSIIVKKVQVLEKEASKFSTYLSYNYVAEGKTAEVVNNPNGKYKEAIVIPEKVMHEGEEYTVTKIGDNAFKSCSGLTSVTIPSSVTSIGNHAFSGCTKLTSLTIPDKVTSIGEWAFSDCAMLTSMTIPDKVTSIGGSAFANCYGLQSVTLGKGLTTIPDGLFFNCVSLSSLTIPKNITSIDISAFWCCSGLAYLTVESGNPKYDSRNDCNAIIETESNKLIVGSLNTTVPNTVTSIGNNSFYAYSNLTSITIPDCVTSIGQSAFFNCSSLTSIEIPDKLTFIGSGAFLGTEWYNSQPEGVIYLDKYLIGHKGDEPSGDFIIKDDTRLLAEYALSASSDLTSVAIPNSVMSIGEGAFAYCDGLISVTVESSKPLTIEANTFSNSANATLIVPQGAKAAYKAADNWKDFKEINELKKDDDATYVIDEENNVTVKDDNGSTDKEIDIPEIVVVDGKNCPVTTIGEGAYKNNTSLVLVCIPESVDEIGKDAFSGCSNLSAIYCYDKEPIAIGSGNAKVRTRAGGEETPASTVFAGVDKETCILYVPKNSGNKYRNAVGWGEFQNIVEMESNTLGDANNDGKIDNKDVNATVDYIMVGKTEAFIFKNADTNIDKKVNAADIVKLNNLLGK